MDVQPPRTIHLDVRKANTGEEGASGGVRLSDLVIDFRLTVSQEPLNRTLDIAHPHWEHFFTLLDVRGLQTPSDRK